MTHDSPEAAPKDSPLASIESVSLVLGSGGARGLAQIGVIRRLTEAEGVKVTSISGASTGAVVGGMYAAGALGEYESWVRSLRRQDVWRLLDFSFSGSGLFRGDRLIQQLREMLGDVAIEELPVNFTAVATDIRRKREVWLQSGSLFDAIRASIAIPTVFTPVRLNGKLLVDGGILNPVPMGPTLSHPSDATVAVSMSGRMTDGAAEPTEGPSSAPDSGTGLPDSLVNLLPSRVGGWLDDWQEFLQTRNDDEDRLSRDQEARALGFIDMISHSLEAMQGTIARFRLAVHEPDHLIEVPVDACGLLDFHRAGEMIDLGYELADRAFGSADG